MFNLIILIIDDNINDMVAVIVLDVGTTSIRGILYNQKGQVLNVDQHINPPIYTSDGRVEQAPSSWQTNMYNILSQCVDFASDRSIEIEGIAITASRSSVIPVDQNGNYLHRAIMWQDRRAEAQCRSLKKEVARIYNVTGSRLSPVFSAPKIQWIVENEPEIHLKTYKYLGIQDFLIHSLTGEFVTDHSFASRTNLMNLTKRVWDRDMLNLFNINEKQLCTLIEPGSIAGSLTSQAAALTGLPTGLPVISAGGDQNCAALGLGIFSSGSIIANTGTGSYIIAHTDTPVFEDKMRISCNASAVPGAYILEASLLTSGSIYRWFTEQFYMGRSNDENPFAAADADATEAPAGANGLILLPYFKGSGSPDWNPLAKGSFLNLSLSTTRGDMIRAILEGIAAELADNLNLIERLSSSVSSVKVSGGLTSFDLFNRIQADFFGKPVIRHKFKESTALGAWLNAAKTIGIYSSYDEAFSTAVLGTNPEIYNPDAQNTRTYKNFLNRRNKIRTLFEQADLYSLLSE